MTLLQSLYVKGGTLSLKASFYTIVPPLPCPLLWTHPVVGKNLAPLKNHFSQYIIGISGCAAGFLVFSSDDVFSCGATGDGVMAGVGSLLTGTKP